MDKVCLGLDCGREKHDYVLSDGRRILKRGSLPNQSWAFESWCNMIEETCGTGTVRVALETANGLATPLDQYLEDRGWTVLTIPPDAVKSYRENVLRQHDKTDQTDAHTLAIMGAEAGDCYSVLSQPRRQLRRLTRW